MLLVGGEADAEQYGPWRGLRDEHDDGEEQREHAAPAAESAGQQEAEHAHDQRGSKLGTPSDLVAARSTLTGEHLAAYVGGEAQTTEPAGPAITVAPAIAKLARSAPAALASGVPAP
jgi:hypothetical protein